MNEHIEIEYKILLTQDIFQDLLKQYPIDKEYSQTNDYFSHPLLEKKKYMLRVREKNHHYELTLKRPMKHHRLETNVMLSKEERDHLINHIPIDNEIIDILKEEGLDPLTLQQLFSLTTYRYDIVLKEGILSLDKNTYLNHCDYELEFECDDEKVGYQKFLEIIKPYHLDYQENCMSKVQRAFQAYQER